MISLDHLFRQGDLPQVIWPRCFRYPAQGTLLPQRIFLAEPDCERASARGHLLERYGYEVLSCCNVSSIKKCFHAMAQHTTFRSSVNLVICDSRVIDETLTDSIQRGQACPDFPPLLLLSDPSGSQIPNASKESNCIKYRDTLEFNADAYDQVLLVRQWAPY